MSSVKYSLKNLTLRHVNIYKYRAGMGIKLGEPGELSYFSHRNLSLSSFMMSDQQVLRGASAFSSRPSDHCTSQFGAIIIFQQPVMFPSLWRVRSQVPFGICWALGLLVPSVDHSLWWQSYLGEQSLTLGQNSKVFFKLKCDTGMVATDRLMSLPCLSFGLSLSEVQKNTSAGEIKTKTVLVSFSREVCRPAVFWAEILWLASVLPPITASADML